MVGGARLKRSPAEHLKRRALNAWSVLGRGGEEALLLWESVARKGVRGGKVELLAILYYSRVR